MIPPQFDYHAPGGLDEALTLLGDLDDAKVMSGGQSLLPMMKLRLASPANIIDIGRVPGLDTIEERDGCLRIGALVTETQLEASEAVAARYPILLDTARVIADPLVRNRATVCGNIAHGDPANDHPATMLALRAHVIATGPGGERTIDIDDFFHGFFMTALGENEILTELHVPTPPVGSGGAYVKLERKVGDYAVAGAAAQLSLAEDGTVATRRGRAHEPRLRADPGHRRRGGAHGRRGGRRRRARGRRPGRRRPRRPRRGPPRLRRVQEEHGPRAHGARHPHGACPRRHRRIERWRHTRSTSP